MSPLAAPPHTGPNWDIVCRVVDFYGDAGVALRLARGLARRAAARGMQRRVRLIVDSPTTILRLIDPPPTALTAVSAADDSGRRWIDPRSSVEIIDWSAVGSEPAQVVVETFGGGLPPSWQGALAAHQAGGGRVVWINLEHLSAEQWVEGCHRLASPRGNGLDCHFLFPGFSRGTGGLLPPNPIALQLPAPSQALLDAPYAGLTGSLFCYPQAATAALFDAIAHGPLPVRLLLPSGIATPIRDWPLGETEGSRLQRGLLELRRIPFLDQDTYDSLLAACDLNLVRGEDSFVRAQWAARPLLWQAYRQAEDAQLDKLDAFIHASAMPAPLAHLHSLWNSSAPHPKAGWRSAWLACCQEWPALQAWSRNWRGQLGQLPDLLSVLEEFVAEQLQSPV